MTPAGAGSDEDSLHPAVLVIALLCASLSGVIIGACMVFYLVKERLVVIP